MQYLRMPFKRQMMLCGYKNEEYRKYWKYLHYGIDVSTIQGGAGTDPTIYASGDGTVIAAGKDNSLGGAIAILYKDCIDRDGNVKDIVARYMHLTTISVETGDKVVAGDVLGIEGKEGTGDYHLHLEFDIDTDYPLYSPQVSYGHTFWKKGTDSTVNPSLWMFTAPDQVIVKPTYNPAWLEPADLNIPAMPKLNVTDDSKKESLKDLCKKLVSVASEIIDTLN